MLPDTKLAELSIYNPTLSVLLAHRSTSSALIELTQTPPCHARVLDDDYNKRVDSDCADNLTWMEQ